MHEDAGPRVSKLSVARLKYMEIRHFPRPTFTANIPCLDQLQQKAILPPSFDKMLLFTGTSLKSDHFVEQVKTDPFLEQLANELDPSSVYKSLVPLALQNCVHVKCLRQAFLTQCVLKVTFPASGCMLRA